MSSDPPILPRSWKHRYPFRLGTTSFIYPAGYRENVVRLGDHLDEIELLMFESRPSSRPSKTLVDDLQRLGAAHAVSYNVHLPTDLALSHPDEGVRHRSCRILKTFLATLTPLNPTVYVLHLPPPDKFHGGEELLTWQRMAGKSLEHLLQTGLPTRRLALENLLFPFEWLRPLVEAFDLGVCLDIGHLAFQEDDLEGFLNLHGPRIVITHLHGLCDGKDHAPLGGLPKAYQRSLTAWLRDFGGSVSLEVFGYEPLLKSLTCLDGWMASAE